jgi:hypothetical protein
MENFNQSQNNRQPQNAAKPMPPGMRKAFAYILLIAALFLALLAADKIFTQAIIAAGKAEATAKVTAKEATTSRSGRAYYIAYEFQAGDHRYQRKVLFGLIPKMTQVRLADYQALPEGSDINIVYSKTNPAFNLPVNDPYRNNKLIFILLGVLIFGFISFNEFKNLRRAGRNQSDRSL